MATGESVYVPKVLTRTQCAEDHAELLARGMEGGREEEVQQERWEKGRWRGGRGGLSWRTDTYEGFATWKFLLLQTQSYTVGTVELDFTVAALQSVVYLVLLTLQAYAC